MPDSTNDKPTNRAVMEDMDSLLSHAADHLADSMTELMALLENMDDTESTMWTELDGFIGDMDSMRGQIQSYRRGLARLIEAQN